MWLPGADISELAQIEIDWKLGTIKRKRSKTRKLKKEKAKKVPTVTYRLWPKTLELLLEYNSGKDPVLLTVRGLPWIISSMDSIDDYSNSNSIASNFKLLAKKSGVKIGTKDLRTAAATTLGQGPYKAYGEYFLGEVPSGTASKFYIPEGSCLPSTEFTSPEFFSQIPAFLSLASENPSFESFSHA